MNSPLEQLVIEVGGELDRLAQNGRQLNRKLIITVAAEKAYALGYSDGQSEHTEHKVEALMEGRTQ